MDEEDENTVEELHKEEQEDDDAKAGELDVKEHQDAGGEPQEDGNIDIKTELDDEEQCEKELVEEQPGVVKQGNKKADEVVNLLSNN